MTLTLHSHIKGQTDDTLDLGTRIDVGVVGLVVVLILLAKIHTTRQFTQYYEIGTTKQFLFQGGLVQQTVERGHRTHIRK